MIFRQLIYFLFYFIFLILFLFIYLFIFGCVGLRLCARAFSSCSERGALLIPVRGPLTIAASPAAEHRLQTRRLSSCGSRSQLLRGTWDPPRPGLEPASPALAGRFSTTAPPGKPLSYPFYLLNLIWLFVGSTVVLKAALFILFPRLTFTRKSEFWNTERKWQWIILYKRVWFLQAKTAS